MPRSLPQRLGRARNGVRSGGCRGARLDPLDRRQKAVSPSWKCLEEPRRDSIVSQRGSDLPDTAVETRIEVDVSSFSPDVIP